MKQGPTDKQLIEWAVENKRVDILVEHKWGYILSPGQIELVRKIAFLEHRKMSVSAMTRWGKSFCVTIGLALLIDFGVPAKIAFLGPKQEQAGILRQYLAELILADKSLLSKAQIYVTGEERIVKEASRKRMTFKTGAEYRVFSGEGDADRLMGFGCDILIRDEACLINRTAYAKSSRMLGDHPESAVEIELFNPWKRDNKAFEHTLDPEWHQIHIGWQQAVKEGRTTQRFIDQQRKDLLPMEFTVLYDSNFPEQGEDSLFSLAWINAAEKINFNFHNMQINLRNQIEELRNQRHKMGESQFKSQMDQLQKELAKFINIIACDLAEGGKDETVIIWGIEYDNKFQVVGTYSEPKSEPMRVVGRIVNRAMSFIPGDVKGRVNIDRIGIGSGPLSRLKEVLHTERNLNNIKVTGCHFGEKAIKKDIFHNKKAENYFRLADLMRDQMIDIPVNHKIRAQLVAEGKDRTSSNRRIIVDPEDNSPDWADALVYLVWKDKSGMQFAFS
jgi:hypothetical protein